MVAAYIGLIIYEFSKSSISTFYKELLFLGYQVVSTASFAAYIYWSQKYIRIQNKRPDNKKNAIFQQFQDGIIIIENQEITYFNESVEEMYDFSEDHQKLEKQVIFGTYDQNSKEYGEIRLNLKDILRKDNLETGLFYTNIKLKQPKTKKKQYLYNTNDEIELSDIQNIEVIKIVQFVINNDEQEDVPLVVQIRDVSDLFKRSEESDEFSNYNESVSLTKKPLSIESESLTYEK